MDSILHPDVDMIWNFWPFTIVVWLPIRGALNFILLPAYVLTWWYSTLWNLINENVWRFFYYSFWVGFIISESLLTWFIPFYFL